MSSKARKGRGRQTELMSAAYYRRTLWPQCQAVAASAPGRDLLNTPGAAVEIKARSKFSPMAWARQAQRNAGDDMPLVLMRPIGFGEQSLDDWLVFMRNKDFVDLWKRANGGGGSRRAARRAARKASSKRDQRSYAIRVGPTTREPSSEDVQARLSPVLHELGFEPGDYEIQIQRVSGGASAA